MAGIKASSPPREVEPGLLPPPPSPPATWVTGQATTLILGASWLS